MARDVKLLDLASIYPDMQKINPAYKLVTVPKGTYAKQDKDVQTIGYYIASAVASAYALFLLGTHWAV